MKKICYVTTVPLTMEAFVLDAAEYLHNHAEWDVSVICDADEEFAARLPEYIHYYPVPMKRGVSLSGIKALFQMVRIFKKEKFDLVQYSTPNASLYAAVAAKLVKVPVRLYCQWGMAYVGFSGIKRKVFKAIEKLVCRLSTRIEPDSYGNLAFAHSEGLYPPDKSSVIWNGSACGVDLEKFDIAKKERYRADVREKHGIPADAYVFGFVGRVTRDKGINELFEATKQLMENDSNVYLLMVGPAEVDDTVDSTLYRWSKENDRVIFCGYTREVEKYLSAMDCYVLPSYREGFGMSVVEAEAMGVPVIVTDIPGPTDAMIDNKTGLVVKKKDVPSLYAAMRAMTVDTESGKRMGEEACTFAVERFEQKQLFRKIAQDRAMLVSL